MQWPKDWLQQTPASRRRAVVWCCVLVASIAWCVWRRWVCDDVFITFRYCDNLLAGLGPVYNASERSEGYTHFLWFMILTLGRSVGIDAATLGRWMPMPFFVASLWFLVRISSRLFKGRGGLFGVPVAALAWALHEEARLFGSGGLETAAFTCFLLIGFECACLSERPRRGALAGWAFAIASLLRPDGLYFAAAAAAFLLWRERQNRRVYLEFAIVTVALVAPLFAFRLAYYGYPLPNPYYAKSGGLTNWPQGLLYARLYFQAYTVLLVGLVAIVPAILTLLRARHAADANRAERRSAAALAFAGVATVGCIFYVVRVGGDFMFGRFFLPVTPFLLLLVESLVQRLPRLWFRIAATAVLGALVLWGARTKHHWLDKKKNVAGVVDEPQFYPESRLRDIRLMAERLRVCLEGTRAVLLVQGGEACLAYYARFPVAIELYGLTDTTIAHQRIRVRGRPGHEKPASAEYLYKRGLNLTINYQPVRSAPMYTQFGMPGVTGVIYVYDRALMEHLKSCRGAQFLDFPRWLEADYIPQVAHVPPARLRRDWNHFQLFYFQHNADPEGLRDKLRAALAACGLTDLPEEGTIAEPIEDRGNPSTPPTP